jgi:hypothetical protein
MNSTRLRSGLSRQGLSNLEVSVTKWSSVHVVDQIETAEHGAI